MTPPPSPSVRYPRRPPSVHHVASPPSSGSILPRTYRMAEVLSPSTASIDRAKKLPIYWREGVGHARLLDPTVHTLEVFRRHDLGWLLVASVVHAEPFDAIALDLAGL